MSGKLIIEQGESLTEHYDLHNKCFSWKNKFGKFHRKDNPAVQYKIDAPNFPGYKAWMQNGKFHREDGPAIIYPGKFLHWWLNGLCYPTKESFLGALGDKVIYINEKPYLIDGRPIQNLE